MSSKNLAASEAKHYTRRHHSRLGEFSITKEKACQTARNELLKIIDDIDRESFKTGLTDNGYKNSLNKDKSMFIKIAQSPYLNLLSGLVLLATAGYETWANIEEVSIGAHHGILIFSIVHLLKTIPEFMQGLKDVNESKKTH